MQFLVFAGVQPNLSEVAGFSGVPTIASNSNIPKVADKYVKAKKFGLTPRMRKFVSLKDYNTNESSLASATLDTNSGGASSSGGPTTISRGDPTAVVTGLGHFDDPEAHFPRMMRIDTIRGS